MHVLLFVYGTLRRGFVNRAARRLHERGEFLGFATVRGRLHDCGRYPGMTRGEGMIRGEVFRVTLQLLRYLDAYEGAAFRREQVVLRGHAARAFAWLLRDTGSPL